MGVLTVGELKPSISGRRTFRPSSSIRHATESEWPICDVSSDLVIEVGASSFALHKFPIISRSGRIRKLISETKDSKVSKLHLSAVPGGAEAFSLAAKFCYGVNVEITNSNVAMLHCIANFLEMTDELGERNLKTRTESYLKEEVFPNISSSISVLCFCEALRPVCEDVNLVNRLINSISRHACNEQLAFGLLKLDHSFQSQSVPDMGPETASDWWGKSLMNLTLGFFQRVLSAMKSKGLKQEVICKILINYAQNSLQDLPKDNLSESELRKKQKVVVEAIVSLLPNPSRNNPIPMAFLSSLLKAAIALTAATSCRSDLERRISLQLDQAILEDILIPSKTNGNTQNPMYDIESIIRIFTMFLRLDEESDEDNRLRDESEMACDFDSRGSPKHSSILKVSKLLDNYLAEVALDSNLIPSKFIELAELLPDHCRLASDGLYRAIDIFLKAHPNIKDADRYQLSKSVDCQKLSQDGCSHAAQNERLPLQMTVQVLYFEQMRLKNAINGNQSQPFFSSMNSAKFSQRAGSSGGSRPVSPRDNYASVRRENRELKLEVARMRMRLTELEKDHNSMKKELVRPSHANKLMKSFTRKLSKINVLFSVNSSTRNSESRYPFHRRWRHSIS